MRKQLFTKLFYVSLTFRFCCAMLYLAFLNDKKRGVVDIGDAFHEMYEELGYYFGFILDDEGVGGGGDEFNAERVADDFCSETLHYFVFSASRLRVRHVPDEFRERLVGLLEEFESKYGEVEDPTDDALWEPIAQYLRDLNDWAMLAS